MHKYALPTIYFTYVIYIYILNLLICPYFDKCKIEPIDLSTNLIIPASDFQPRFPRNWPYIR